MFEFHGWAVLRMTYTSDDDAEEGEIGTVQNRLTQEIAATEVANHFHFHDGFNGMASLTVFGLRNHRRKEVIDIFDWLAENAPGSYGLLYVRDDEDPREEKGEEPLSDEPLF